VVSLLVFSFGRPLCGSPVVVPWLLSLPEVSWSDYHGVPLVFVP
jgi:hypothetical protein